MDYRIVFMDGYECEMYNESNDIPEDEWLEEGYYIEFEDGGFLGPYTRPATAEQELQNFLKELDTID